MVNDKESFTCTPTNNKIKIILTPIKSPITQIKGGIKKLQPHKRKFFFQHFHKGERENGNGNRIM